MRTGFVQHASSVRAPSLAARSGLARTFGGLAGFVVITLLCGGFYILQDAFRESPHRRSCRGVLRRFHDYTRGGSCCFSSSSPAKDSGRLARNDALVMQLSRCGRYSTRLPKARARTIHATICRINAFTWITPASGRKCALRFRRAESPESSALQE